MSKEQLLQRIAEVARFKRQAEVQLEQLRVLGAEAEQSVVAAGAELASLQEQLAAAAAEEPAK